MDVPLSGYANLAEQRFASWHIPQLLTQLGGDLPGLRTDPVLELDLVQQEIVSIYNNTRETILANLKSSPERAAQCMAAWFLSNGHRGSGRCLNWRGGLFRWNQMSDQEFRDHLRLRLLTSPIFPFNPVDGILCPCRGGTEISHFPSHALDCGANQGLYIRRHNAVVERLVQLVRVARPGSQVRAETRIYGGVGESDAIIADIRAVDGTEILVFDVTITDPACKTHIRAHNAANRECAGAISKEQLKREKYSRVAGLCVAPNIFDDEHLDKHYKFIPFAVEATGRLGPTALLFLKKLRLDNPAISHEVSFFLYAIGAVIARANSQMIAKCRRTVEPAPPTAHLV
jgi:hypothetical protein